MQTQQAEPLWDEGISAYLSLEYEKRGAPLTGADLQYLASEQAVRVGDLLETLFLMAIYGVWHYCDEQGNSQELDENALDEFYAKGRIGPDEMAIFSGVWIPAV